jgi:hypothetical protein
VLTSTRGRILTSLLAAALLLLPEALLSAARASFSGTGTVNQASITSSTLASATSLAATGQCQLVVTPTVKLTWTPTTSTYATSYKLFRSATSGGPYALQATISGRATATFTDTTNVSGLTTYYYVIQATYANWSSVNSAQATGTTPICL